MGSDVLDYLNEAPLFSMDAQQLEAEGFTKSVDHPSIPGHVYYEGYRHASRTNTPVLSMNPREGCEMPKLAAPKELCAFLEATREVNAALFTELARQLTEHANGERPNHASALLAQCIHEGRHLADCSIQVHCGDAVPAEAVAWHTDAPNSCLHMAVSIRGRRGLHTRLAVESSLSSPEESEVEWQEAGDVYTGCPATFQHAVEYVEAPWASRMVAVQCRMLLTTQELYNVLLSPDCSFERSMIDVIGPLLGGAEVLFPSVEQVRAAALRLDNGEELPEWWALNAVSAPSLGQPSEEAMAAMEKANAFEAEGDLASAKEWIREAGRLGHNLKKEHGGWK